MEDLAREGERWTLTLGGAAAGKITSAAAVVLASGGFEWNPRLRRAFLPFPVTPISAPSNEGDGLELGLAAGAAVADMTAIWGVPVISEAAHEYDGERSGRMGNVEMTLPGSITVNAAGKRFVNEALNYHDASRVFASVDPRTGRQQNNPAWLVFDAAYLAKYPVAGSAAGSPADWMTAADALEELSGKLGIDPAGLAATVVRFNADAARGVDTEFHRGATPQDRFLGDAANMPNPCLAPLTRLHFTRSGSPPACSEPPAAWTPTSTAASWTGTGGPSTDSTCRQCLRRRVPQQLPRRRGNTGLGHHPGLRSRRAPRGEPLSAPTDGVFVHLSRL